jgi:hypothetical protein
MNDDDRALVELAEQPLDDADDATLEQVRQLYAEVDPPPAGLVDRVMFSLALDEVFDEVAEMSRVQLDDLAVRGGDVAMKSETLTFSADPLNALVTVAAVAPGSVRVDGWLTPAGAYRVRLRVQDRGEQETEASAQGRFSFEDVREGTGQLSFTLGADAGTSRTVVTPVFTL